MFPRGMEGAAVGVMIDFYVLSVIFPFDGIHTGGADQI